MIGTKVRASASEAAFANAVLGHGLVREDMHTGSVSHLGVVIFPTISVSPDATVTAAISWEICRYEIGASGPR